MPKSTLLIEMIDLIRERPGVTVNELAATLVRSERTIYRWLSEVSNNRRITIRFNDGGYYLMNGDSRQISLTPQELLALRLSLKSSPFAEGSPVRKAAESAWLKIRDVSPSDKLRSAETLAATHDVSIHAPPGEIPPGVVETIERAIDAHQRLRVVYRSQKSNVVKEYTIDPYGVAFRRHSWYVVAFSLEHKKVIQLKLVRFVCAQLVGEMFDPPPGFSVEGYFRSSWEAWAGGEPTTVKVLFSARVAGMIAEVKRHPSQMVDWQPDGGIIFEAIVSGIEEIAAWIMGYGKEAVVLEPRELRQYVIEQVNGMADSYLGRPSAE